MKIYPFVTRLQALLMMTPLLAGAAAPSVYPTPQQVQLSDTFAPVKQVRVLLRSEGESEELWKRVPKGVEGAYAFCHDGENLTVLANDEDGVYYAKQTISQLLDKVPGSKDAHRDPFPARSLEDVAKMGPLPVGTVADWPDLPCRGVVEGYYGAPWSFDARRAQFEFYGRNKMNTYIYAPKDDPFHHGMGCYKEYSPERAEEIRKLAEIARANHVKFVWAIHPANTVRWQENGGKEQLDGLCAKLEKMYELGVRDFGVFVDDSFGEITKAERQVALCDYIMKNFIRRHPDVAQKLVMCPTGYNKAWANRQYLTDIGEGLSEDVDIMWTGDTVVHDIELGAEDKGGQRWVNALVKRPTYVWWNWPCSDFKRGRLSMGRTYGLGQEPEMKKEMSGFVANPMEYAEASKVGLFGVADYVWNVEGFRSDETWREGVRRLYPSLATEMQVFCDHNSYLLPNNHGYFREESAQVAEELHALREGINEGTPPPAAVRQLSRVCKDMEEAGRRLLEASSGDASRLREEIEPWFRSFELTGRAGVAAAAHLTATGSDERMEAFLGMVKALAERRLITRNDWQANGKVLSVNDVETASYAVMPAVQAALNYASARVFNRLSGNDEGGYCQPVFTTNRGYRSTRLVDLTDDNDRTFWDSGARQESGDWYCMDYGKEITIRTIKILMGGIRRNDYAAKGVLEYSSDGERWTALGKVITSPSVERDMIDYPIKARYVRFRVLEPRRSWMCIREFSVNTPLQPIADSNCEGFMNATAFKDNKHIGINRVMETTRMKPGEYVELSLPAPLRPQGFEINMGNADIAKWSNVEFLIEDGSRQKAELTRQGSRLWMEFGVIPSEKAIVGVRLTHAGEAEQEVNITSFRFILRKSDPRHFIDYLMDADCTTVYCCDEPLSLKLRVPKGSTELLLLTDATCAVEGGVQAEDVAKSVLRFKLEPGRNVITLNVPTQPGKVIYEMLFR